MYVISPHGIPKCYEQNRYFRFVHLQLKIRLIVLCLVLRMFQTRLRDLPMNKYALSRKYQVWQRESLLTVVNGLNHRRRLFCVTGIRFVIKGYEHSG